MMKLREVFRFRMRPDAAPSQALAQMAGARRFVWNWALAQRQEHYQQTDKGLPLAELSRRLRELKQQPETAWLGDVDWQALQQVLSGLRRAYQNFFQKRARFPRFKSPKRDQARFRIPQRVVVSQNRVDVPKVGVIRIRQSQPVAGKSKSATFKQDACGNWDVTLVTEFTIPDIPPAPAHPGAVVGVDLGLKDFAVLSDGRRAPAPQLFRRRERKLRRAQRTLARRRMRSRRRAKAKQAAAWIQAKTANQRVDFLHKLTTELVGEHEGLCLEDLSVRGLAKTKLATSILDASWGEFRRQIAYKTVWNRKHLAKVRRFYPSSKTCHVCGAVNGGLTLADRTWTCVCGILHDRGLNAARNILSEGLKRIPLAAGRAGS